MNTKTVVAKMKKSKVPIQLKRFLKYSVSGGSAFAVDLTLLFLFASILQINYLVATGLAFCLATTVNFSINKKWGFKESKVSFKRGYLFFMLFATFGVAMTVFLVGFFVETFDVYYIFARIFVAGIVGIFNFIVNYMFTFNMREELSLKLS